MTINQLLASAIECERESPRFAFIAPYLKQAKLIAWDYVHRYAEVIPGVTFNESELRCDLPGDKRIQLYGADNPDSIQGIYLDGVVMDEYQLTNPRLFSQVVRPMLADRQGWVIFAGKPLGHNHFFHLWRAMQEHPTRITRLYRASETGILSDEELRDMRVGPPGMSDDEYAQEMECSWEAAVRGAYYARQMERIRAEARVRTVPWLPEVPVNTYWDLGIRDSTAIVFAQTVGREIHVIDYLEANGQALAYYATELQRKPYLYGEHVLPHDGGNEEIRTGMTIAQWLRSLFNTAQLGGGARTHIRVLERGDVQPGIEAVRRLLPRCWFDETRCRRLVDCLSLYRQSWDEKRNDYRDKPEHDEYSHGADAFRYMAVGYREVVETSRPSVISQFDPINHGKQAVKPRVVTRWRP